MMKANYQKPFVESTGTMLIHPVKMKALCLVAYMFNVGGNDRILFQKREWYRFLLWLM